VKLVIEPKAAPPPQAAANNRPEALKPTGGRRGIKPDFANKRKQANSHLKASLIPRSIYVMGYKKVTSVLMVAVACLAALKYLQ
jgi:hypothetical protein